MSNVNRLCRNPLFGLTGVSNQQNIAHSRGAILENRGYDTACQALTPSSVIIFVGAARGPPK